MRLIHTRATQLRVALIFIINKPENPWSLDRGMNGITTDKVHEKHCSSTKYMI